MTLEQGLVTFLEAFSPAIAGGRIHPLVLPQNTTLPAVTYQRISGPRVRSLSGPGGKARARIQIDVWDSTYLSAKDVATQIRQALDGYKGLMGTVQVDNVSLATDWDRNDPNREIKGVSMDFMFSHVEA